MWNLFISTDSTSESRGKPITLTIIKDVSWASLSRRFAGFDLNNFWSKINKAEKDIVYDKKFANK